MMISPEKLEESPDVGGLENQALAVTQGYMLCKPS
jgi:hypothetical protein